MNKQLKFTNLNQQEFLQAFNQWRTEYERRVNFLTNDHQIPSQTSQELWKGLKKYPCQAKKCFFCQQISKDFFFLDHGDFWACLDCYQKYHQLNQLHQAIKWELQENERKFPPGWHCATPCEQKTELDCCTCCTCAQCPKEKVYQKKLARFRIKTGKLNKYDQLIIEEELQE